MVFSIISLANDINTKSPPPKKIRVGAFNYFPAIFRNEENNVQGFIPDILKEIAKNENWEVEFVYGSWEDCLARIRSGKIDLMTSVAFTEERSQYMDYSKTNIITVWATMYSRDGSEINDIFDIANKRVAIMKKDFNSISFQRLIKSFNVKCELIEFDDFGQVFSAIENEAVDAGIASNLYGTAMLGEFSLKSTGVIFNPFDIFFTTAKGDPDGILQVIDSYLESWKANENSPYHSALDLWAYEGVNKVDKLPYWFNTVLTALILFLVILGVFIIVLKQKVRKAVEKVEENEKMFRDRFHYFPFPSFIYTLKDNEFVFTVANKAAFVTADGKLSEKYGESANKLLKNDTDLIENLGKCYSEKSVFTIEKQFYDHSTRRDKFESITFSYIPQFSVHVTRVDITEQKLDQRNLREQKNLFETMFNSISDAVIITNTEREIILANKGVMDIFGYSFEDLRGISTKILYDDDNTYISTGKDVYNSKSIEKDKTYVVNYRKKDGSIFPGETFGTKLLDENNIWIGNLGIIRNIDERVNLYNELREAKEEAEKSEAKQLKLISNISDVIAVFDPDGFVKYVSPNIRDKFDWAVEDILSTNYIDNIHQDQKNRVAIDLAKLHSESITKIETEFQYLCKSGSYKPVEFTAVSLLEDEHIKGIVANFKDISERKSAEKALLESEKLSVMGELASSVAHDFNNSLQSILGNLQLALRNDSIDEKTRKYLKSIEIAATDSGLRIKMLQRVGQKKSDSNSYSSININELLDEVVSQARPLWKDKKEKDGIVIKFKKEYQDLPKINCNISEIRTAFYNIIKNCIEAMDFDGKISISSSLDESDFVRIDFEDTGCGMNADTKQRIFQPFFSTKGFEGGRGMGMSGVYTIIRDHNGTIEVVRSAPGEGTLIRVCIPLLESNFELDNNLKSLEPISGVKVLWVDDDVMIQEVAEEMLECLEYSGDVVGSADEGLKMLEANQYDLIVTDIGMPGMNGWQFIEKVKLSNNNIKIAVLSGWGENITEEELLEKGIDSVLSKPFKMEELEEIVNKILAKEE